MSTVIDFLVVVFAGLIALFLIWRGLREDYQDAQIFSVAAAGGLGALIGRVVGQFIPLAGISFWLALAGSVAGGYWWGKKSNIRLFELLESAVPAYLLFLVVMVVWRTVQGWLLPRGWGEMISLFIALGVFYGVGRTYRRFLWYPSGKIGLAALLALVAYFLSRALAVLVIPNALLFSASTLDIIGSIMLVAVCVVTIYIRSGRELGKDFRFLKR